MDKKRNKTIGENKMIGSFVVIFGLLGIVFCVVFMGKILVSKD